LEFSTYHGDYYGEGGDDVLFSVGFNNYLSGGSGNDTVSYKGQDEDEDLSGSGMIVDLSNGYAQTRETSYEETLVSIENAIGTGAADELYGTLAANRLWGDGGNDVIQGRGGNDIVYMAAAATTTSMVEAV
jgi:serralysin